MKKKIRKGLFFAGGFFVVLLVLLFIAPLLFKNKAKEVILSKINGTLNAELYIENFGISVFSDFPHITLSIDNVSLSGTGNFAGDTLAKIRSVDLVFSGWEALKGHYQITDIGVDRAEVHARVLENGSANWNILRKDTASVESITEDTEPIKITGLKLALRQASFKHSSFIYEDMSSDMQVLLSDCNGLMSGDITNPNALLNINYGVGEILYTKQGITYLSKIKSSAESKAYIDKGKRKMTITDGILRLNDLQVSFAGTLALPRGGGKEVDIKIDGTDIFFKDVLSVIPAFYTNHFDDLTTSGQASIKGHIRTPDQGKENPQFNLKMIVPDAMFKYSSLPKSVDNINLELYIDGNAGTPHSLAVDVPKFNFSVDDRYFSADLNVHTFADSSSLRAKIRGEIDMSILKDIYPLDKNVEMNGILSADLDIISDQGINGFVKADKVKYEDENGYSVLIDNLKLEFLPAFVNLSSSYIKANGNSLTISGQLDNIMNYRLKDKPLKGYLYIHSCNFDTEKLASVFQSQSLKRIIANDLHIPFTVGRGKIMPQPFSVNIGNKAKLNLSGVIGLDQTIDYKGSITLPRNSTGTTTVSFSITGALDKPKVSVDAKSLLGNITRHVKSE